MVFRASASSGCAGDLGTRLGNEEKHSLSVGSKQIRPPPSPEHEPRSRSFDQSRNANSNDCCTGKISLVKCSIHSTYKIKDSFFLVINFTRETQD